MQEPDLHMILTELVQASSQDEALVLFRSPISAHQYLRLYRLVVKYVKPGSTVLDWGVGNGHFSYFLVKSGYTVSGYSFDDIPKVCSAFAPEVYTHKRGSFSDPISLPYGNQVFDAVVSLGVLEHVRVTGGNEVASLKEIFRTLKPGGHFICFHLPNRYSWIEALGRMIGRWTHRYRYTFADILSLSSTIGFEVIEIRRYAILPRNIWWWGIPKRIGSSFQMARLYDRLESFLSVLLSPICQNYLFVAKKRI